MNLIFDFDFHYLCITHVSIEFECIHIYMSLLVFLVERTKVDLRTGRR